MTTPLTKEERGHLSADYLSLAYLRRYEATVRAVEAERDALAEQLLLVSEGIGEGSLVNTGPYPASSSTPLYGAPVTDAYYLKSIEQAFLDFHRSGDYATFARVVRDVLVAWRGAS